MLDSILRGTGTTGNVIMTVKNFVADLVRRKELSRPNYRDAAWKLLDISPPLDAKLTKVTSAGKILDYRMDEIKSKGFNLENPAAEAIGKTVSAFTNVPLDRVLRLYDNTRTALAEETETWQKVALLLGWSSWDLGIEEVENKVLKPKVKRTKKIKPLTTQ